MPVKASSNAGARPGQEMSAGQQGTADQSLRADPHRRPQGGHHLPVRVVRRHCVPPRRGHRPQNGEVFDTRGYSITSGDGQERTSTT